ncbi:MAG: 23S rRNA (adenine(2503)-C(2))-methyltransferase RlmN [Eubacteriales bacterium]|jgi:23S rRNA (adenine2503-C2)-methyltransferase
MENSRPELLSLLPDELSVLMASLGEPGYRARQLFEGLHRGLPPDEMTNIGKATKEKLRSAASYHLPEVRKKLVSKLDGTIKYLFELADGNCIESVLMKYKHGNSICVSTQVGCSMGCDFCASTIGGRVRNLNPGEILGQVIAAQLDAGERISNIVMMGIGEPLDNYDNVIKFLHLVNHEYGLNIGYRHISLSTCGLVDKIYKLRDENLPIILSISLHAADDSLRSRLMPINRRWGIAELLDACREYYRSGPGRRISFEYILIPGLNDSPDDANKLADLLNSCLRADGPMPIHVNLIPQNKVYGREQADPGARAADPRAFAAILERRGIRATLRRRLGADINASCGQLRRESTKYGGAAPVPPLKELF